MKAKNKKALLLTGLFLAVIAAGYANYALTNGAGDAESADANASDPVVEEDVFSVFKAERETTREQELRYIDAVVESAETDAATKADAQAQKLALAATMESELLTEGLIQTKLGVNAVVTIKAGAVNVVVDKTELTEEEVTQIAEIIKTQTDEAAENIKIMPTA